MTTANSRFRLGLVINPFAGIGGQLAYKGSDGAEVRQQAKASGNERLAMQKTHIALSALASLKEQVQIVTAGAEMGEQVAAALGFEVEVVYQAGSAETQAEDTEKAVTCLLESNIDLLLFAGGDGTARNLVNVFAENAHAQTQVQSLPVLGIPAGVKIHSGVYAVTPAAAGRVLQSVVKGELVSLMQQDVRDIDEAAFRQNKVIAKHYGELWVPQELTYIQAVKMGGKESEPLVLDDIAETVIEQMRANPETLYVMGSGSTVAHIMQQLGLANTLLGVDLVCDGKLIASDLNATQLIAAINGKPSKLVVTLIGGQGHILGRGNQQLSAQVIRHIGRENIMLVATKAKLMALAGKSLVSDSGDAALDTDLAGPIRVITGYNDSVLYPLADFSSSKTDVLTAGYDAIDERALAYFSYIVETGTDQALFTSGYLSGHFDLVLSKFSPQQVIDQGALELALMQSLATAFTQGELESDDQLAVYAEADNLLKAVFAVA